MKKLIIASLLLVGISASQMQAYTHWVYNNTGEALAVKPNGIGNPNNEEVMIPANGQRTDIGMGGYLTKDFDIENKESDPKKPLQGITFRFDHPWWTKTGVTIKFYKEEEPVPVTETAGIIQQNQKARIKAVVEGQAGGTEVFYSPWRTSTVSVQQKAAPVPAPRTITIQ